MSFHFRLQTVLRVRQIIESKEQLYLQKLFSQRAYLQASLEELRERRAQIQREIAGALVAARLPAAEMQFAARLRQGCERSSEVILQQLATLAETIEQQRNVYAGERRKREVLESLRESQMQEYLRQERRQQQARVDELHLLRRARSSVRQPLPNADGKACPAVHRSLKRSPHLFHRHPSLNP